MRTAIFGDVHANLEALWAVLADAREQECSRYVCLGDVVGYHASPRQCIDLIRALQIPCVKGNHDEYCSTTNELEHVNARAVASTLWTRGELSEEDKQWLRELKYVRVIEDFTVVHATLDTPHAWGYVLGKFDAAASFLYQHTALCFFGHTHRPMVFQRNSAIHSEPFSLLRIELGRKYFVNVGSVGEPRDGDPRAAYAIYDCRERTVELRRVAYDFEKSMAADRAAGLMGGSKRKCVACG